MLDPVFLDRSAPYDVQLATRRIKLPILYRDARAIVGVFAIDAGAASAVLPRGLRAVRVTPRRGVLVVACFDYKESSVGSYGEVAVGILASPRWLPPLVGVLAERRLADVAVYVRHLPVTTEVALDAGRAIWGYPKFLADIRFEDDEERRSCELSEGTDRILKLSVRRVGRRSEEARAFRTYTVLDGKLLRTSFLTQSELRTSHRPGAARLELGSHRIGREIASWSPSRASLEGRVVERMQSILPPAEWVSPMPTGPRS